MKNQKITLNKKNLFITIILLIVSIISIFTLINYIIFPKEINLIAGTKHKIELNIPVTATIKSEERELLNINDKPLVEQANVSFNKPIYIQSDTEGSHNLKLSVMGIPIKNVKLSVLPNIKVVPSGASVGVRINTDGVMVLGIGKVDIENGQEVEPANKILKAGDLIVSVNNKEISHKEDLIKVVESNEDLNIKILRNEVYENVNIKPVKGLDGKNKIGVWVRDSTQGIGTLTYYNKDTRVFGALGHGIIDVDTKEIMKVKDGKIMPSEIIGVRKGEKGSPGELLGEIKSKNSIGEITFNSPMGIYGRITDENLLKNGKDMDIGLRDEVELGEATILCNVNGEDIKEYKIKIENINKYNLDSSKSMVIRIVDEELLGKTNGIVQGMSGSPIIQNNKIIGAVTHVFVNEPDKGYGIFIENMIKNE